MDTLHFVSSSFITYISLIETHSRLRKRYQPDTTVFCCHCIGFPRRAGSFLVCRRRQRCFYSCGFSCSSVAASSHEWLPGADEVRYCPAANAAAEISSADMSTSFIRPFSSQCHVYLSLAPLVLARDDQPNGSGSTRAVAVELAMVETSEFAREERRGNMMLW